MGCNQILDSYIEQLIETSTPQAPAWNIEKLRAGLLAQRLAHLRLGLLRSHVAQAHGHAQLERVGVADPLGEVARIDLVRGGLDALGRVGARSTSSAASMP